MLATAGTSLLKSASRAAVPDHERSAIKSQTTATMPEAPLHMLIILLAAVVPIAVMVTGVVWATDDAKQRGGSPLAAALLIIFLFPAGWLVWLIVRPSHTTFALKRIQQKQRISRLAARITDK